MATNVTWDGTVYSIPAAGEYNWATLSNFLIALGNKAAVAGVVKQAIRKATSSPVTVSATTDYAVVTDLTVAGAVAVNLPAGVNGQVFIVCDGKADAATNNVTINAAESDTIKGQATLVMNKNRQVVMLQYNSGDNDWKVLNYGVPVGQVTDSDISGSISTAGKVSGSAITSGTIGGSTAINTSGTVTAAGLTGPLTGTVGAATPNTGAFTTLSSTQGANLATSSGSVGIGTASPSEKLHVSTTADVGLKLSSSSGSYSSSIDMGAAGAGGANIKTSSANPLLLSTNNTERVRVDATGNVGIGTSIFDGNWTPKLQTSSTASDGTGGIVVESGKPSVIFKDTTAGVNRKHIFSKDNKLTFASGDASQVTQMTIDNTGNVGIGTSNPQAKLDVTGDIKSQRSGGSQLYISTPSTGALLYTVDNGGNPDKFVINPDGGNVGIRTSSPGQTLDVNGAARISGTAGAGFLEVAEQSASPSTPASGYTRIYSKSDNKLYYKDDLGTETQFGAGGSGEVNLVENPSDSANWGSSTPANLSVTTNTTAANNPLNGVVDTSIAIYTATNNEYARYRFTMPSALKNRKLKVEWFQIGAGIANGAYKVEVWTNAASNYGGAYTKLSLSTDSSGTSSIPNFDGKYATTFDTTSADYYELRIVRTAAGAATLYLANVVCGPGIQPQGAVVQDLGGYAPTYAGFGTVTNQLTQERVGRYLIVRGRFTTGTVAAALASISVPLGLTIDSSSLINGNEVVGQWWINFTGANAQKRGALCTATGTSTSNVYFAYDDYTSTNPPFTPLNGNLISANSTVMSVQFKLPIAEWAGSGTVQLAQNDVIFYGGTGGTWGTSSTLTTTQGPGGVQGGTTTPAGTFFSYTIVPTSPIGTAVTPKIELSGDGKNWGTPGQGYNSMNLVENQRYDGTNYIGVGVTTTSTGNIVVTFGKYAFGTTGAWAGTWYWRIVVAQPGAAVGFGIVQPGVSSGLVSASGVPGNTTGNAIASGYVGQSLEATTGPTNLTTAQYSTLSLTLGAGVWLVTGMINYIRNGATITGLSYNAQIVPSGSGNPSNNFYYAIHDSSFSSSYNTCTVQAPATVVRCDGTNITVPGFTSQVTDAIQLRFYAGTFTGGPVQASAVVRAIRIA